MSSKYQYGSDVIPLVCLDVDGTLVGESGVVTATVWTACDQAIQRGQHLAICTARGAFGASWEMAKRLDPSGWHVFHAGGATVHSETKEVRSHAIDPATVFAADQIAAANDWIIEFYTAADYVVDSDDDLAVAHAGLLDVPHKVRQLDSLDLSAGGVVRLQYVVDEKLIPEITTTCAVLGLTITSATSPIMPGAAFVSLTSPDVTKATGISMIATELGVSMDDVMMVGDGSNDLPAIEAVGHPVAMGNATPEVKAAARHTVASVAEDGVVEALLLSSNP